MSRRDVQAAPLLGMPSQVRALYYYGTQLLLAQPEHAAGLTGHQLADRLQATVLADRLAVGVALASMCDRGVLVRTDDHPDVYRLAPGQVPS